ncbi:hypothetical protein EJ05DRAFT_505018 [Pseudovirgaria hyperparasitica]|uniref:F-box domain-containing protein n=1 Tax=Pseudovirgaria hyperparasitica TaxID=470096 RepID=A0A6A6VRR8_9PEZI|nr:uncharacterized protein EJ05DRAFT_505018 [Pseudovirgaria hyperparasitica]KAF2753378.1 hypothetical protein EJ05DRAFT_505018 [Pseudovirgaria hyperparasitica]
MPSELREKSGLHFLQLPAEIRNNIYEHALVSSEPVRGDVKPHRNNLALKILRLNCQIWCEANVMLYARNVIDISHITSCVEFGNLLTGMGAFNVCLLRHIRIPFPRIHHYSRAAFQDDYRCALSGSPFIHFDLSILANLETITFAIESSTLANNEVDTYDLVEVMRPEIIEMNESFRRSPRLREIVMETHPDHVSEEWRQVLEGCGWVIKEVLFPFEDSHSELSSDDSCTDGESSDEGDSADENDLQHARYEDDSDPQHARNDDNDWVPYDAL